MRAISQHVRSETEAHRERTYHRDERDGSGTNPHRSRLSGQARRAYESVSVILEHFDWIVDGGEALRSLNDERGASVRARR